MQKDNKIVLTHAECTSFNTGKNLIGMPVVKKNGRSWTAALATVKAGRQDKWAVLEAQSEITEVTFLGDILQTSLI